MNENSAKLFLWKDIAIILLSIMLAVLLVKSDVLIKFLASIQNLEWLGSFVTGIFFTSIFTTFPAIVTLGEIAQANSIFYTALFGAMGAVIGDLIIFRFIRDRFANHVMDIIQSKNIKREINILHKLKFFRWITFLVGGLIIASPLPDELGISLLGFSKMKTYLFITISFIFNFIGILIIGGVARAF